jgi:hypothetical protein
MRARREEERRAAERKRQRDHELRVEAMAQFEFRATERRLLNRAHFYEDVDLFLSKQQQQQQQEDAAGAGAGKIKGGGPHAGSLSLPPASPASQPRGGAGHQPCSSIAIAWDGIFSGDENAYM